MELWDGYCEDGTKAGVDIVRGGKFPKGLYHIVADIIVRHTDGTFLVMLRDFNKDVLPGKWQVGAGGSVLKNETALDVALRELYEETGIRTEKLTPIYRETKVYETGVGAIYEGFLFITDMDKSEVTLQVGETIDFRWIDPDELERGDYCSQRAKQAALKIAGR